MAQLVGDGIGLMEGLVKSIKEKQGTNQSRDLYQFLSDGFWFNSTIGYSYIDHFLQCNNTILLAEEEQLATQVARIRFIRKIPIYEGKDKFMPYMQIWRFGDMKWEYLMSKEADARICSVKSAVSVNSKIFLQSDLLYLTTITIC